MPIQQKKAPPLQTGAASMDRCRRHGRIVQTLSSAPLAACGRRGLIRAAIRFSNDCARLQMQLQCIASRGYDAGKEAVEGGS
jgi:hypothetical protein